MHYETIYSKKSNAPAAPAHWGGSFAWGETKKGTWDLTKKSAEWTASGNESYFSQPYGFKKANGTLTNKSIADFSINGISQIKVGFKCLQNGSTNSQLTIWLVDKDGKVLGDGVVVTPVDKKYANRTTYQYATFTTNLEAATGFMMKVTKFGKNILVNGAEYEVEYSTAPAANLTSIAVSGTPTKTTYKEGEEFKTDGLVVAGTYDDGTKKEIKEDVVWVCDPQTLSLGTTEVNVTASYGGMTASKTVAVTVTEVQKYNVTWNVNGKVFTEGNPTTEVVDGEKVEALPTTPASIGGLVFMGWTNEAVTSQEAAPDVLFTSAVDAPAVTSDVTYYAVFACQSGSMKWKKVSLANVDEGIYALITPDGHAFNGGINNGHGQATADAFVFDKSGVAASAPEGTLEITLSAKDGGYTMFNADTDKGYLLATAASSGSLAWKSTENSNWLYKNNNWLYSDKKAYLRSYSNTFRTYGNNKGGAIYFVKKVSDVSYSNYTTTAEALSLRAFDGKNHFATFSSDKAVKFVDATVYAVGVNDNRLVLTEVASKQVPANTGVLLKSAGTEATYSVIGSASAIENNLLCASVEEGQTTAADGTTDGYSFFKLSYNRAGENEKLGFYWAAENGAPFISKAGLAYLAVKTTDVAAVKGFSLIDMETGISKVSGSAAGNGVIYDLQGRRVEHAVRGLYIVNGRKVMVK